VYEFIFYFAAIKSFQPVYITMEKEIQNKSLDRFFRNEYQKLVNFVRKNLDERYYEASPEDIIQDVALGLIDKLDLDTQIGNLTGYIYRSVKNKIIDFQKKKQRTVSIENFTDRKNENYLLNTVTDETLAEENDYADIEPEMLQQAILKLRPDEQAVIIATEFEQRSFEELSAEWDTPIGTLLSRKHRSLSKLHRILLNNQTINNVNHGNNR
jgi:RNA polymerase sigma-70 factor (ECF subfamily)